MSTTCNPLFDVQRKSKWYYPKLEIGTIGMNIESDFLVEPIFEIG